MQPRLPTSDLRLPTTMLPRYDIRQSYQWNYIHAPDPVAVVIPPVPGEWAFCGMEVDSPLGIPAGPLLNGRWCIYYASLGFDVLTYKTVRSGSRACYGLPNLQPVACGQLQGAEADLPAISEMQGSWAVSFGMPSRDPRTWQEDVAQTRKRLPRSKRLVVSVVGTVQPQWSIDDLALDYAQCARWAVDSGAEAVETNFSCPNVTTCDGQLYQQPAGAATVAACVRQAIGNTPLLVKIGHVVHEDQAEQLLEAIGPFVNALSMTNSVPATVRGEQGPLFDGQPRGICGDACRTASLQQVRMFHRLIQRRGDRVQLVGVGGISTAEHAYAYLESGAHAVQIATAAMVDPLVAVGIREAWSVRR